MLLWLIPTVQKFPRTHRFALTERIQRLALNFQDQLTIAGKRNGPTRKAALEQADVHLAQLRFWLRFSRDLNLITLPQYEHAARLLTEVGRLLGAWLKQA
jgi:hypothetical protein